MPRNLVKDAQVRREAFKQVRTASQAGISELMNETCEAVIDQGGFCDADAFYYAMFGRSQDSCRPSAPFGHLRKPLAARLEKIGLLEFASGEAYMRGDVSTSELEVGTLGLVLPSRSDMGSRVLEYRVGHLHRSSDRYLGEIMINSVEAFTGNRQPAMSTGQHTVLTVMRHDGQFGDSTAELPQWREPGLTLGMMAIRQGFVAQGGGPSWNNLDGLLADMREYAATVPVGS